MVTNFHEVVSGAVSDATVSGPIFTGKDIGLKAASTTKQSTTVLPACWSLQSLSITDIDPLQSGLAAMSMTPLVISAPNVGSATVGPFRFTAPGSALASVKATWVCKTCETCDPISTGYAEADTSGGCVPSVDDDDDDPGCNVSADGGPPVSTYRF